MSVYKEQELGIGDSVWRLLTPIIHNEATLYTIMARNRLFYFKVPFEGFE